MTALEQRQDAAVAERDQARLALTAQRQQRAVVDEELRVTRTSLSQSRAESEAAQNLNVPLQDDRRPQRALGGPRRGAPSRRDTYPRPGGELKPANLVPRLAQRRIELGGCPCGGRLSSVEKPSEPRSTVSALGSSC
ncbi:hypothetical protein PF005_g8588 [Phytophthora fragariae]|uniref:Uncharacterized protein n=1 Tax=Phytophthora fragariae TaxID=53985 RepID=A0A6A3F4K2_9STRA|nr:hypothetical protein PF009_g9853 [Phytophthora fragariae]KAE8999845.1 hypothetical protein PF011_g14455 [Phytophthora fragariae]KAE9062766.1 hypothetical protein PF007_g29795 [Phytophthora fragariae]KAE9147365.1 hypothetical protein PF006_g7949 [Phytophthora fragariae]KAE9170830.1 hypothetical protein PF002_g29988 [Phytophthora fragariae]